MSQVFNRVTLLSLFALVVLVIPPVHAHIEGQGVKTAEVAGIRIQFATRPVSPSKGELTDLLFSIQDIAGRDLENVTVSVTILRGDVEVARFPTETLASGELELQHTFDRAGLYEVTLVLLSQPTQPAVRFSVTVAEAGTIDIISYATVAALGIVVVVTVVVFLRGRRRKPSAGSSTDTPVIKLAGVGFYGRRALIFLTTGAASTLLVMSPWSVSLQAENLAYHMMGEHIGYALGALLLSFGVESVVLRMLAGSKGSDASRSFARFYARLIAVAHALNRHGALSTPIITILLVYWHAPINFNAAVLNEGTHILMHLSFVAVGLLIYLNMKTLPRGESLGNFLMAMQVMMVGGILLMITPSHYYFTYPFAQQLDAGLLMAVPHPFITALIAAYYFSRYIWRWLGNCQIPQRKTDYFESNQDGLLERYNEKL